MKKFLTLGLAAAMALSFAACNAQEDNIDDNSDPSNGGIVNVDPTDNNNVVDPTNDDNNVVDPTNDDNNVVDPTNDDNNVVVDPTMQAR